ncbi:na+-driven multidrug efflux pump [Stylonychia lemnae]|uniref:Na+-driven multidrug efflux pump n=1 Tax=Stylonychia lemnae TaxID=5949 RepID=A0A078B5U4_STYLE|nr:na+-driven multidrug efflux pump [Stylonychia lemnae]|eukprot:CDW88687.1 na+-driven multidrug efflux pump [Stylonychia lemnae]
MNSPNQQQQTQKISDTIDFSRISLLKSLLQLGFPVIIQQIMNYFNQAVNIYYAGYDPNPAVVAGVGLGNKILIGIGIDKQTANFAQIYISRCLPGLIALSYFDIARQYLVAINKPFFLNFFLIHLILYFDNQYKETWFLGGKETFYNLILYVKLAIPAATLQSLEYFGFEILCIASGFISVTSNAAQVIVSTVNSIYFMIPAGLGMATTTIIGNLIGQQKSKLAFAQNNFIVKFSFFAGTITCLSLLSLRNILAHAFTQNDEVKQIASDAISISFFSHFLDFVYCIMTGSIKALTKFNQSIAAGFIAFYVIGCPTGIFLALYIKMGVPGLWIGLICGQLAETIYYYYLLNYGFNWEMITLECFNRQEDDLKITLEKERLLGIIKFDDENENKIHQDSCDIEMK